MARLSKSKSCVQFSDINGERKTKTNMRFENEDLIQSALWLPPTTNGGEADLSKRKCTEAERLYLPRRDSTPCSMDEYLSTIPKIASRSKSLLESMIEEEEPSNEAHKVDNEEVHWCGQLRKSKSCLNVLQGEVAHVSPSDADIVVSADATTCHVVAIRSTKCESVPLVSLAHVDEAGTYDACLEAMVQEHIYHHAHRSNPELTAMAAGIDEGKETSSDNDDYDFFWDDDRSNEDAQGGDNMQDSVGLMLDEDDEPQGHHLEQKQHQPVLSHAHTSSSMPQISKHNDTIDMELHVVGGYLDKSGTSQELSTSIITTFSELADKYRHKLRMSLSTAAISCMNTETKMPTTTHGETGNKSSNGTLPRPRSRGLAIDTRTGEVFPVKSVPKELEGPAIHVRNARAFAQMPPGMKKSLSVIHDSKLTSNGGGGGGDIRVEPFHYEPMTNLNVLLNVPDEVLLKVASTSPECESENFCTNFRKSLSFINTVPLEHVFGTTTTSATSCGGAKKNDPQPLIYSRSSVDLNKWERVRQRTE